MFKKWEQVLNESEMKLKFDVACGIDFSLEHLDKI